MDSKKSKKITESNSCNKFKTRAEKIEAKNNISSKFIKGHAMLYTHSITYGTLANLPDAVLIPE